MQQEIPENIKDTFERIKREYPHYLVLKVLNGKYYVYKHTTKSDKNANKVKSVSEYLGKINQQGLFIKKGGIFPDEYIQTFAKSQKPLLPPDIEKLNKEDLMLLQILSMNARADLSFLGKKHLGLNPPATFYKVKQLEKKLGIKYFAEIDFEKLGYLSYLVFVKFEDKKPLDNEIKNVLENEPRIQLACSTSGKYDLMLYILAKSNDEITLCLYELRSKEVFKKYIASWYIISTYITFGYIPVRDKFFELLKKSIWKRNGDFKRKLPQQLTKKEYFVLRELNINGIEEFSNIDKKYNFKGEGAAYTYHKLMDNDILKRITISSLVPFKEFYIFILNVINMEKFDLSRKNLLSNIIEDNNLPCNNYALTCDIGSPIGALLIYPNYYFNNMQTPEDNLKSVLPGVSIDSLIIKNLLLGQFCFRKFDSAYSIQQITLIKEYKEKQPQQFNYFRTSKKSHIKTEEYVANSDSD